MNSDGVDSRSGADADLDGHVSAVSRRTADHRIGGVQQRTRRAWTRNRGDDRLSRHGPPLGGHFRELGKRVLANGRVRAVNDVPDSEGITRIATTGSHGTGRYRSS